MTKLGNDTLNGQDHLGKGLTRSWLAVVWRRKICEGNSFLLTLRMVCALLCILLTISGCNRSAETKDNVVFVSADLLPAQSVLDGLEFPDGRHANLGQALENAQVEAHLKVRNGTQQVVRFKKQLDTTCGCASGMILTEALEPGEQTEVVVSLTVPPLAGEKKVYKATALRFLDDGGIGEIDFTFELVSKAEWFSVPSSLSISLLHGESKSFQVGVIGSAGKSIRLLGAETNLPGTALSFTESGLKPDVPVLVSGTVGGDVPSGKYRIVLRTDDTLKERVVPVVVKRSAEFSIMPQTVLLRDQGDGVYVGKCIFIRPVGSGSISIDPEHLIECEIGEDRSFDEHRVLCDAVFKFKPRNGQPSLPESNARLAIENGSTIVFEGNVRLRVVESKN